MKNKKIINGKMKNSIYGNAAAALLFVALAACLAQAGNVIVKNGQLNSAF